MSDVVRGHVTAPSGFLMLGHAGSWDDYVREHLAAKGAVDRAISDGGGVVGEWLFRAAVVPAAADRELPVAVHTAADGSIITKVEARLGVPCPRERALGGLSIDQIGMVLGDMAALHSWVGLGGPSTTGRAQVAYWGMYREEAKRLFGGERLAQGHGAFGWPDLPEGKAAELVRRLNAWDDEEHKLRGLMTSLEPHNDLYRLGLAAPAGVIEVGGQPMLGIEWGVHDFRARHQGGTRYPVTLSSDDAGEAVLRWAIPCP